MVEVRPCVIAIIHTDRAALKFKCDADGLQRRERCLKYMHTSHKDCVTGQVTATHALPKQSHTFISNHKAYSNQKLFEQSFGAMVHYTSCHSCTDSLDFVGTRRNNGRKLMCELLLYPYAWHKLDNTVENPGSKLTNQISEAET